jgi:hypothetical protein
MTINYASETRPFHLRFGTLLPLLCLALLVLALAGCGSKAEETFAKIEPKLLAPEDGKTLDNMPRNVVLTWHKVEGAARYQVELQMQNPMDGLWMPTPIGINRRLTNTERLQITFPGSQPGRWRVTAINGNGTRSRASEWWRFEFISGY